MPWESGCQGQKNPRLPRLRGFGMYLEFASARNSEKEAIHQHPCNLCLITHDFSTYLRVTFVSIHSTYYYTLYIIHYTLYIIHYTLYIIHYSLFIIHYSILLRYIINIPAAMIKNTYLFESHPTCSSIAITISTFISITFTEKPVCSLYMQDI